MKTLFAVTNSRGESWDAGKQLRSQQQWDEHAAFMDRLAEDGFVVLGGPLNNGKALLIIDAADENEIRATLAQDPWHRSGILELESIKEWTILLQSGKQRWSF